MAWPHNFKKATTMNQLPDHKIIDTVFSVSDELNLKDKKLFEDLSSYINHLIIHDFERLVSLLYRIDVDEKKLQSLLGQLPENNAADTIATLIIERQFQKIKSRQENRRNKNDMTEEESW
jgi:hypothetical protein